MELCPLFSPYQAGCLWPHTCSMTECHGASSSASCLLPSPFPELEERPYTHCLTEHGPGLTGPASSPVVGRKPRKIFSLG